MIVALDGRNYDEVPQHLLRGEILDIGAHTGVNALLSRHSGLFIDANTDGRYHGVERDRSCALLRIEYADITRSLLTNQYDCILMLHVLEHIHQDCWSPLFDMLKGAVRRGGALVVGVPFNEARHDLWGHVVFHIVPETLEHYLPGARYGIIRSDAPETFRRDGRRLRWWLKLPLRILLGDLRKARQQVRGHWHLLAVWREEAAED